MKTVRARSGPFAERPHFEPAEIDRICVDELRKAGCLPSNPEPIRIDRFIEKKFGLALDYEDLPSGVLGYTKFGKNGVERIVMSRQLAEEDTDVSRRRERATMAHEAGHGLLHAYLFVLDTPAPSLFGAEHCSGSQILCRDLADRPSSTQSKSTWSEFQANGAIGGLLLPRSLVLKAVQSFTVSTGNLGGTALDPSRRSDAERHVAAVFDVNPVVARIRLDGIFAAQDNGQMQL